MTIQTEEAVDTRRIRVRLALVAWSHPCPRTEAAVRELRREQARAEGFATTPEEEAAADAHLARALEGGWAQEPDNMLREAWGR